jgi:hypothetical protein
MDEAIWFWAGMISVIIGLVILSRVANDAAEQNTQNTIENALNQLQTQCNFVCREERGTRLGVRVAIPTGSIVTTTDELVCIENAENLKCTPCDCRLEPDTALDLTIDEARFFPTNHVYECRFHNEPPVSMRCIG